jgi:hypothetical protein
MYANVMMMMLKDIGQVMLVTSVYQAGIYHPVPCVHQVCAVALG